MKSLRTATSIFVGLLAYLVLRYAVESLMQRVSPPGPISAWTVLSSPLNLLFELLPGFLAGWLSSKRGLLAGFVVAAIGSGTYSALVGTATQYVPSDGSSQSLLLASWFLVMCIVAGVFSAMAGGSAQLLRSNNSFKPKPLRGSA